MEKMGHGVRGRHVRTWRPRAPTGDEADRSLQRMTEVIRTGVFGSFMPFDRQGNPVLID